MVKDSRWRVACLLGWFTHSPWVVIVGCESHSHDDNSHVQAITPCSAYALIQVGPTMSCI